jgi:hypothetical protein
MTVKKVPPSLDHTIAAYYGQAPEETRLEQVPFRLEEIRTRELIQRHAPAPPATVVDVGGAAGAYAVHRPDGLRAEVQSAGLTLEGLYGLEGPGWFLPDLAERWADLRRREDLLRLARQFEAQPSVLGVSAHLLAVARKPKVATGARA